MARYNFFMSDKRVTEVLRNMQTYQQVLWWATYFTGSDFVDVFLHI